MGERGFSDVSIFGGAHGADEWVEVAAIKIRSLVKERNAGGVPGARDEGAGPEGGLGVGAAGDVGYDVGDNFGW